MLKLRMSLKVIKSQIYSHIRKHLQVSVVRIHPTLLLPEIISFITELNHSAYLDITSINLKLPDPKFRNS